MRTKILVAKQYVISAKLLGETLSNNSHVAEDLIVD